MESSQIQQPDDFNWDAGLQLFCFQKLSPNDVDGETHERATAVIAFVSKALVIPPPKLVWIKRSSPEETSSVLKHALADELHPEFARVRSKIIGGYAPQYIDHVWIRSDVSRFPDLEFVAAHETRHIWQKAINYLNLFCVECRAELDAYPYADDVLKEYLRTTERLSPEVEEELTATRHLWRCKLLKRWPNGRFEALTIEKARALVMPATECF
jgi:hypothetical protein